MIEVEICNFQSIEKVNLSIDGFTALTGRSNIGKSAIRRAIQYALVGASGTEFVRHNKSTCARHLKGAAKCSCFASVRLTFPGGNNVLWEKGDTVNQYSTWATGEPEEARVRYTKVGRDPEPPPILSGFTPVKIGDDRLSLQVAEQFDPIFLLDAPGTAVAEVLSDVADLDRTNVAAKAAMKDRKDADARRKVRDGDVRTLETTLAVYAPLDDLNPTFQELPLLCSEVDQMSQAVLRVREYHERLKLVVPAIRSLKDALAPEMPPTAALVEGYRDLSRLVAIRTQVEKSTEALVRTQAALAPDMPDTQDLLTGMEALRSLRGLHRSVQSGSALVTRLQETLDALPDVGAEQLSAKVAELREARSLLSRLSSKLKAYKSLQSKLPTLEAVDTSPLREKLDALTHLKDLHSRLVKVVIAVRKAKALPEPLPSGLTDQCAEKLASLRVLRDYAQSLTKLEDRVRSTQAELDAAVTECDAIRAELDSLGSCPFCSRPYNLDHKDC